MMLTLKKHYDDGDEKELNEKYIVQEDTLSSNINFADTDCGEVEAGNESCSTGYVEVQELFNEIPSSSVVDRGNFNGYLDLALTTELENLELRWTTEYKLKLLTHTCLTKKVNEENFVCLFKGCDEVLTNI
uniref:Uncharacterized protein n=1 Tax=Glossina austeni TaxID=7395 RepID=A0A1A9VQI6_GLOAU